MRPYTLTYLKHFGYSVDQQEYMPCEICSNPSVDVHHIEAKKMGGSKLLDYIENLMGLCRVCHDDCHAEVFSIEWLKKTHVEFLTYFKEHGRCRIQNLRA